MKRFSLHHWFLAILVLLSILSFFPFVHPYEQNLTLTLSPPDWNHWLGTDHLGRDLLSRNLVAIRYSLILGISITALTVGVALWGALLSVMLPSFLEEILMRVVDALLAFPFLLLAIAIASLMEPGWTSLVLSLVIAGFPGILRLIRGSLLVLVKQPYIEAARAAGVGSLRLISFHLLPNLLHLLIVIFTIRIGSVILSEAALSFLGLGLQPPVPTLGNLIDSGTQYLFEASYWPIASGLFLTLIVFAFNLWGDEWIEKTSLELD